ncbi:MAG: Ca-activated chloride channel [Solirubrobacteraceae bacterium]|nr:Ca-activated chloride channel [Solirubrobacteraceae bacterium]
MSFASPIALLCLFAVPLAVLAHVAAQRRRRRYPVRFTALSTLAVVAGAEPQWRRHLPLALFALALAALSLSLARPERTVQVPVQRASVVLVTDVSRSMSATDVSPTRLEAAHQAALSFLGKVPKELRVGLVTFSDVAQTLQTPTTDHNAVKGALGTLQPISGTATGAGLRTALDDLKIGVSAARRPPAALVLLSDGSATDGAAADIVAAEAKRLRVPIYTVALGTNNGTITLRGQTLEVPPDTEALRRIAAESGGQAFRAEDSDQLDAVYQKLGSQIGTRPDKQEITALFAGGALLLLAGAMMSSLRLGGRLP